MQTEQDLTDRARRAKARAWHTRALPGRLLRERSSAANGGADLRLIATTVCALIMLACGDERPPWSGFPIVLPDAGGFEISPDLASSLLAAQAAFAKQLAEQGAPDAGAASMGATSPMGARRAAAGAAAPKPPSSKAENEPETDSMSPVDAGAVVESGMSRPSEMHSADGGAEMPARDAAARMPNASSGPSAPSSTPDAGPTTPAAGGGAPTPTVDAGTQPPAAGDVAPVPAVDAGIPLSDSDAGS